MQAPRRAHGTPKPIIRNGKQRPRCAHVKDCGNRTSMKRSRRVEILPQDGEAIDDARRRFGCHFRFDDLEFLEPWDEKVVVAVFVALCRRKRLLVSYSLVFTKVVCACKRNFLCDERF